MFIGHKLQWLKEIRYLRIFIVQIKAGHLNALLIRPKVILHFSQHYICKI